MPSEAAHSAWLAFCDRTDTTKPIRDELWDLLIALYRVPHRVYHTLDHAHECILALRDIMDGETSIASELALWFHDAVYVVGHDENESASALMCDAAAAMIGLNSETRSQAVNAILATRHLDKPDLTSSQAVADADMSILGSEPDRYAKYALAIRQEWAHVDDESFNQGRHKFLRHLLNGNLFHTQRAKKLYNDRAVKNILREIEELES